MAFARNNLTFIAAGNGQYIGIYRENVALAVMAANNYFNGAADELKRKSYPPLILMANDKTDVREPYLSGNNIRLRGTGS